MASNPPAAPILFDRALLRARQHRARALGPATFLLDRVAGELEERLGAVLRQFKNAADIGTSGDQVRDALAGRLSQFARIDLPERESEPLALQPQSLDLAVSALAFQFVNDLPGVLAQIRRALKPDGLLLAAMVGGETLTELRQSFAAAETECEGGLSPRVAPSADLRDAGALLQRAGFALPVTDVDRMVVRYDNAFALMADLRRMGATNILVERRRTPTRRATMLRMAQIYGSRFADADGRIRATFDVIWLSGWAPHESQQQPLRPGSAKASSGGGGAEIEAVTAPRCAPIPAGSGGGAAAAEAAAPLMGARSSSFVPRTQRSAPSLRRGVPQSRGPGCKPGPGSAAQHEERYTASGTGVLKLAPGRRLLTSTDRSDAGSAECPPAASHSHAACWHGPRRVSGPRARSPRRPSACRRRAASGDENHHRHGWQM